MLTVHHLRMSQSERVVWLCEELGIDYELKVYNRCKDTMMAPPEYKALHPMGTAPVITDGDLALSESGAILEYIDGKYGGSKLSPGPDDPDFAQHLFWLHYTNGTFMASIMMQAAAHHLGATEMPAMATERIDRCWQLAEDQLGKTPFFGGSKLTTADINMVFVLTTMRSYGQTPLGDRPNIAAYLKRIGEREAYQSAMAKAEPGMAPNLA